MENNVTGFGYSENIFFYFANEPELCAVALSVMFSNEVFWFLCSDKWPFCLVNITKSTLLVLVSTFTRTFYSPKFTKYVYRDQTEKIPILKRPNALNITMELCEFAFELVLVWSLAKGYRIAQFAILLSSIGPIGNRCAHSSHTKSTLNGKQAIFMRPAMAKGHDTATWVSHLILHCNLIIFIIKQKYERMEHIHIRMESGFV